MQGKHQPLLLLSILMVFCVLPQAVTFGAGEVTVGTVPADPDPGYTRVITARAQKIVDSLRLTDPAKALKVRDLIADQYRSVSMLHDTCDDQIKVLKAKDSPGTKQAVQAVKDLTQTLLKKLHRRYLIKLSTELTPKQIDRIKDGMTYSTVEFTYRGYLDLVPTLTDEQKKTIMADLIEAREIAMDAGSSKAKHAWFNKYKGRINNYLSAQGIDLKKAERQRRARHQAAAH